MYNNHYRITVIIKNRYLFKQALKSFIWYILLFIQNNLEWNVFFVIAMKAIKEDKYNDCKEAYEYTNQIFNFGLWNIESVNLR